MIQLRIQIIATGEFLVLAPDGALSVQLNSTLFNGQDDLLTSKSFPGTAPLEPNKAKIKNAHLMLTDPALRKFRVLAWLGPIPWKSCDFQFTMDNNSISYVLYIDATLIANQLQSLKLTDLQDDILNSQMHFESREDYQVFVKSTTTAAPGSLPMVFFPFKNDGAYIPAAYEPDDDHVYPDLSLPANKYFNDWIIDDFGAGDFVFDGEDGVSETQAPAFYLTYILKRIVRFFGYEPIGKWLDEEQSNRIVVQSLVPVDVFGIINDYYLFMPAIALNEFITGIRTDLGLMIDFDDFSKTAVIESLKNLSETDDVVDLRPRQISGIKETGTTPDAYTITQLPDDKDTAYTDDDRATMPVVNIGDPLDAVQVTGITMQSVATRMITEAGPHASGGAQWRVPWLQQPINGAIPLEDVSSLGRADRNSFKLRLLYYFGMQPNDSGFNYPYASSDNFGMEGALTNFSLSLTAAFDQFLPVRHFYEYQKNAKPGDIDFLVTRQELFDLKMNKRVIIYDFNFATVSALISQISAGLANKELIPVKLTLYPKVMLDNKQPVIAAEAPPFDPPVDNGLVYVRFTIGGRRDVIETHPTNSITTVADLSVSFWEDPAGTIPKDVTDLPVRFQTKTTTVYPDSDFNIVTGSIIMKLSGTSSLLQHDAPLAEAITDGSGVSLIWEYSILVSAFYTVIS